MGVPSCTSRGFLPVIISHYDSPLMCQVTWESPHSSPTISMGKSSLAVQTVRNCSFVAEIIKHARYFPHSHKWAIPHQKLTVNGEDFAEESFIRGTLLKQILTVCAGL